MLRNLILGLLLPMLGGYLVWRLFCCPPRPQPLRSAEVIDLTHPRKGRKGRAALDDYQRDIDHRRVRPHRLVFLRPRR